ncbi:M20/M25/M40 family metallo-hydrolase [Gulosibacter molinativorax]|uniref:Dipeptidase n=1 Tax=Gulosibacter molinativorax TaxID=256821 RepID=A0ABT7C5F4_9MICO|nr:M20/M25/M40 family metallo-hydrolase [Gulosibacter molinativorax]MDJ1370420.1 dipeptidase [Gulosibacter molinativorax]QUY61333.1 Peptidase dimerization domain protein [Gulosibacter molinativorax]
MSDSETPPIGDQIGDQLRDRVQLGMPSVIRRLSELVRIPSVSWDEFDRDEVRRSAEATRELFEATGLFDLIEVQQYEDAAGRLGQPAVLAHRPPLSGYPTVLLYAHHDVQPPGDDAKWRTPAFEPTVIGDRLYARGASDDKAGVLVHVAALEALRDVLEARREPFGLGISILIEGEEENGSRSFSRFLDEHRPQLEADYIIIADSDNAGVRTPSLTVALRGNVTFNLTVRTLEHASHSGMYGGLAPDAMLATVRLLNTLWDEGGAVAVPGLRSHDAEVPEADERQLIEEAGVLGGKLIGRGPHNARMWYQPAITITGIDAPNVANASNTLLPEVRVRISGRVAPGQSAKEYADALLEHLRDNAPFGAELEVDSLDCGEPFLVDLGGQGTARMFDAMGEAWDTHPTLAGIGGSIPMISEITERFPDAEVLVTGVEDPGTMAHSPNESQHLGVLRRAIESEARFLAATLDAQVSDATRAGVE